MFGWTLQEVPIKSLKDHAKNPRQINKDQLNRLETTIDKFGLIDKPIANKDLTIIGGHQRIKILKKQKVKLVQCWVPDTELNEKEVDELCIALNLHRGEWDWDILANQFDALDLLEWGFTEQQLVGLKSEEEIFAEEGTVKNKKMKMCPSCGHEF